MKQGETILPATGRRGSASLFVMLAGAEAAWLAFLGWMAWRG